MCSFSFLQTLSIMQKSTQTYRPRRHLSSGHEAWRSFHCPTKHVQPYKSATVVVHTVQSIFSLRYLFGGGNFLNLQLLTNSRNNRQSFHRVVLNACEGICHKIETWFTHTINPVFPPLYDNRSSLGIACYHVATTAVIVQVYVYTAIAFLGGVCGRMQKLLDAIRHWCGQQVWDSH